MLFWSVAGAVCCQIDCKGTFWLRWEESGHLRFLWDWFIPNIGCSRKNQDDLHTSLFLEHPSQKETSLPTINFQVLCQFQAGYPLVKCRRKMQPLLATFTLLEWTEIFCCYGTMGMLRGVVSFFNQDGGDSGYYPGGFILAISSLLQASRDSKIPMNFAIPQGKRCSYSQLLHISDLRRSYQVIFFLLDLPISTLNILILYIYEMLRAHTFTYVMCNKYLFKHTYFSFPPYYIACFSI